MFTVKTSGIFFNFTMGVDPGYKYIKKFRGNNQRYMMESQVSISSIYFKLKKKNGNLVSFKGQRTEYHL